MHSSNQANYLMIVVSVLVTALCWGVYGPLLQKGHVLMGSGRMRPFICVGLAYLVVAVIGPILLIMLTGMERGDGLHRGWTATGVWWSFIAGAAGAVGALGMLLAFNFGGKPHYVPPLIFGLAPVVNTAYTMAINPDLRAQLKNNVLQGSLYGAGLLLVAVGAVVVLIAAPKAGPKITPPPHVAPAPAAESPAPAPSNPAQES
ncbi:MAG: hypothetical protein AB7F89_04520 [Pirellulaceae bacterium]